MFKIIITRLTALFSRKFAEYCGVFSAGRPAGRDLISYCYTFIYSPQMEIRAEEDRPTKSIEKK